MKRSMEDVIKRAVAAATHYFILQQRLTFEQIGEQMEQFLMAYIAQEFAIENLGAKLHLNPNGNYFDVGIAYEGKIAGFRLEETQYLESTSITKH